MLFWVYFLSRESIFLKTRNLLGWALELKYISLFFWEHTDEKWSHGGRFTSSSSIPPNETICKLQPAAPSHSKRQRQRGQLNLELRGKPTEKSCSIHLGPDQHSARNLMSILCHLPQSLTEILCIFKAHEIEPYVLCANQAQKVSLPALCGAVFFPFSAWGT